MNYIMQAPECKSYSRRKLRVCFVEFKQVWLSFKLLHLLRSRTIKEKENNVISLNFKAAREYAACIYTNERSTVQIKRFIEFF